MSDADCVDCKEYRHLTGLTLWAVMPLRTQRSTLLVIADCQGLEPCLSSDLGKRAGIEPA